MASNTRENLDYRRDSATANAEILTTLAVATGGSFFHNKNDLEEGFRRVVEAPQFSYVLGFSPADRDLDGRFHTLAVTLNGGEKLNIQARQGYYAPKQPRR